jgi:opacity protein-like surface antigen
MSLMFDATYNILARPVTPFIAGGLGWSWVDTNIATGPPTVGCWWYPWYGYVCTGYPNSKTLSGLAYELGAGVRWDFNRSFDARASYNMKWIDFGNTKGKPDFDGFQLLFGWKF